ncbi:hypothetical protein ACT5GY_02215 [Lactiplantibacillus plantarum]
MQRKYIYANLEKLDNLVFAYGIDQSDFVHGIKRLPANLVSLVGVDDNEHAVNAHTGRTSLMMKMKFGDICYRVTRYPLSGLIMMRLAIWIF